MIKRWANRAKWLLIKKLLFGFILVFSSAGNVNATDDVMLQDLSGKQHQLSQYAGRWLIINYWATWCPPCLEEVPELVALYDARKTKDLMVIGVVFDYESIEEVKRYVDDMLMSYPIVLGNDKIVKQIGSADVLPATYLFNPLGKLVKVKKGLVSSVYLETIMKGK